MLNQAASILGDKAEKCQLRVADALDLPFENKAFDFVICNRFIKWLPRSSHVDQVLKEFSRVCRGKILVQWNIKREKSLIYRLLDHLPVQRKASVIDLNPENVKTKYTEAEMMNLCRKNHLEVTDYFPLPEIKTGVRYLILRPVTR